MFFAVRKSYNTIMKKLGKSYNNVKICMVANYAVHKVYNCLNYSRTTIALKPYDSGFQTIQL